ncbi:type I restriction enzyme M protein [Helicobacter pylori Hp H-29]|uniref:N-6 DNA methylase n=1 Tax=Helicobacter pylori TaxID=210 RepID=UPI00026A6627|nr:N-6 DNA methylase [Helicobacter pylori]EJB56995.1 type I restriction enzyme M protein [Helicobacter pylori Hp H-29]
MPNNALLQIKQDTLSLIDNLKVICTSFGLGNDGNEYKIITQCFLYKFLCDKFEFFFETRFPNKTIRDYKDFNEEEKEDFFLTLSDKQLPKLAYDELLSYLFEKHFNDNDLHLKLDAIFNRISSNNAELFNTKSTDKTTIALFESVSQYINEESKRANFTRALLDKLKNFNFKQAFLNLQNQQGYDFFAPIFEYLLKDYNNAGGGTYAEYYTPLSIASIIAKLLVIKPTQSVKIYDPSKEVILIDASKLGEEYTENKNKKTRLRASDMDLILETFQNKAPKSDFCALVSFDEITEKNYSLNPGQYFTIEDTSETISQAEFENLMQQYSSELASLFDESQNLQQEILETLKGVRFE